MVEKKIDSGTFYCSEIVKACPTAARSVMLYRDRSAVEGRYRTTLNNNRQSSVAPIIMRMRTDYFARSLMNRMAVENLRASLFLIIRAGTSI